MKMCTTNVCLYVTCFVILGTIICAGFPLEAKVEMEDGYMIDMKDVYVGARVRIDSGAFATVYAIPVSEKGEYFMYTVLITGRGNTMKVLQEVVGKLDVEELCRVSGTKERIAVVLGVVQRGLVFPMTTSGAPVVEGFKFTSTSPYTRALQALMLWPRVVFKLTGHTYTAPVQSLSRFLAQKYKVGYPGSVRILLDRLRIKCAVANRSVLQLVHSLDFVDGALLLCVLWTFSVCVIRFVSPKSVDAEVVSTEESSNIEGAVGGNWRAASKAEEGDTDADSASKNRGEDGSQVKRNPDASVLAPTTKTSVVENAGESKENLRGDALITNETERVASKAANGGKAENEFSLNPNAPVFLPATKAAKQVAAVDIEGRKTGDVMIANKIEKVDMDVEVKSVESKNRFRLNPNAPIFVLATKSTEPVDVRDIEESEIENGTVAKATDNDDTDGESMRSAGSETENRFRLNADAPVFVFPTKGSESVDVSHINRGVSGDAMIANETEKVDSDGDSEQVNGGKGNNRFALNPDAPEFVVSTKPTEVDGTDIESIARREAMVAEEPKENENDGEPRCRDGCAHGNQYALNPNARVFVFKTQAAEPVYGLDVEKCASNDGVVGNETEEVDRNRDAGSSDVGKTKNKFIHNADAPVFVLRTKATGSVDAPEIEERVDGDATAANENEEVDNDEESGSANGHESHTHFALNPNAPVFVLTAEATNNKFLLNPDAPEFPFTTKPIKTPDAPHI